MNNLNVRKTVACSICGAVLGLSANGLICQNLNCPDNLLEKHEHLPEKADMKTAFWFEPDFSIGTAAASATGSAGGIVFTDIDGEGGED